jgi:alpha-N-arabinofuranosidase
VHFAGVAPGTKASLTVLTNPGGDPFAYNDPFTGVNVVETTVTELTAGGSGTFEFKMPQLSVAVLDTDVGGVGNGTYGGDRKGKMKRARTVT